MAAVYLQLLGDFCLTYAGKPITTLDTPRLRSLVAYLALHRHAPQERHRLAFLFWPDSTEAQALTNLRKHLLHLKSALPALDQMLVINRQTVQWLPQMPVMLDVAEFQALLAQAEQGAPEAALPLLRQAVELYRGELLPTCYDDWLLPLREALQAQYFTALDRLSMLWEERRCYADAIQVSQQRLRQDALHEATYRRLIRLYALNGDRATALRMYHTCVTQLREELGVDPDAETQTVYERLLQGTPLVASQPEMVANAPFVGRQREWQSLQERWRLALRGQPQFVLIAGEAGIGKTRLAEELLKWATHQGFCTARSRCYAAEGRLTYAPIIEWLRADALRLHRAKVAATWLTELARLLPELLIEQPTLSQPEPITPTWQRHHLFEATARALLAVDQPLILLIDDLQWCDKETLELLHFLLRNAATLSQPKMLLVGTARLPDEVDTTHPLYDLLNPLHGGNTLTHLDLMRLTEAETRDLARQMAERTLNDQALQQLFQDTAGNPLFVVETMRATQGQLSLNGGVDKLASTASLPLEASDSITQHLPPKVLAVIQVRLGQLSPAARELCEWGAISGRAFTLDLLVNASKIAPDKAVNALDELWQRRIIREQGTDAYDFSHDRIRDVAAAGISRVRRRYLHRCMAEALEMEGVAQPDNLAASIAAHYDAAGMLEKAIHYYTEAAMRAPQVYANYEAVAHLERALNLLMTLPESNDRDHREFSLLIALGPPLAANTEFSVARLRKVHERAYDLAQKLGVSLPPSLLRILAIHKLGLRLFRQAQEMGQQLLEHSQQQLGKVDSVVYLEGCYVLGVTAFWQGHFVRARDYLQQVADSYSQTRQGHHLIEYGQETGIYCRTRLGWTLWYLGYPDQAQQQCTASVNLAQQLRHPFTLALVAAYSAWCACSSRDANRAEPFVRLLNNVHSSTFPRKENQFGFFDGWLALLHGELTKSLHQLSEYVELQREMPAVATSFPHTLALLAEAYWQARNPHQGLALLSEAFTVLDGNENCWHIAEIYRLKGELLLGQGKEIADAETCFLQALEISRRQAAKSLELRGAMSLARLWDQQDKRTKAYALLAEVYNWFTEGFDTADLQAARRLLKELTT